MLLPRFAKDAFARAARHAVGSHDPPPNPSSGTDSTHFQHVESAILIPCCNRTQEDIAYETHHQRGQFLARQDRWAELADEIGTAEGAHKSTPGGMPLAGLLSCGARADVILAVKHALIEGHPARDAPLQEGIRALEDMLAEESGDMILTAVVSQAHLDIAWAWRGSSAAHQIPPPNCDAYNTHIDRARTLLAPFDKCPSSSTTLATAKCALHGTGQTSIDLLVSDFERLVDLNPHTPTPMRAFGQCLSRHGTDRPHFEARRTADRTQRIWGAGAYTWVMFDVVPDDQRGCAQLDLDLFIAGVHDILDRQPNQHTVNLLAAHCAKSARPDTNGSLSSDHIRSTFADCTNWIVRKHMTELHPLIWARAATGMDVTTPTPSARGFAATGRTDALRMLAGLFKREIARGDRVIFTADGPVATPS